MTSTWTLKENSTGELEVTVEGEAWKKAQKKALNYAKSHMNLKGFRQGQIPDALVKKQLSSKALYDMASEEVANEALSEGIKEHNIDLVARPTLDVKEADDEKAVLVFTCTVLPEVTLGEYKGLDIKKADVEVTEEDVENEVKRVQDRYADWVVREDDDAAQLGDQVVIDFVGTKDGVAFEGGSGENYPLELGSGSFIPGFEEQLIGMKSNEESEIKITFPKNYVENLAGKDATFKVKLHEIKRKVFPTLNDEFVKEADIENVNTVDELKEHYKKEVMERKESEASEKQLQELIQLVSEKAEFEVSDKMIEEEAGYMIDNFKARVEQNGLKYEDYLKMTNTDEEKLLQQAKDEALKNIRQIFVLNEIGIKENITVSDEEVDEELKKMADLYHMNLDELKKNIKDRIGQFKTDLRNNKIVKFLKENNKLS